MNLIKEYNEKDLTIKAEGRIDTITAPEFQKEIESEFGKFDSLTLDFENINYVSSAGLRILIMLEKKLNPEGISFTLINLNEIVKEIISVSGFDQILDIK